MKKIRTIFMGTPAIARTVLEAMIQAGIDIVLVVTQPDKKTGRKQKISMSPVKECALAHDLPVFQPYRIREDFQAILDVKPELIVTCAYGQLVPTLVLDAPEYGCVNLHGSLLPKYRGAAPIQRAIWDGLQETGMSLMKMVPKMDAGGVLAVKKVRIEPEDTSTTLFEKMGHAAAKLLLEQYDTVCSKDALYVPQDESEVTFAAKIGKEEEEIDFEKTDAQIVDQIRALSKEPGAYVRIKKKKFKIYTVRYEKTDVDHPFTFTGKTKDGYGLVLNEGILHILQCQMEGKPVVTGLDFANGQGQALIGTCVKEDVYGPEADS